MSLFVIFLSLVAMLVRCTASGSCMGCVELDQVTFDKMISKFQYSLVKFDIAFPYGEKHEAFGEFAKVTGAKIDELLVSLVGIKDYGEKENSILAARYQVDEKKYPAIFLFKNYNTEEWIQFPEESPITADTLQKFVKDNTDLYIGLDGCLEAYDKLVSEFVDSTNEEKDAILNAGIQLVEQYHHDDDKERAKVYVLVMRKILEKGYKFINEEQRRLENLLKGKINDNKKRELSHRVNILESFKSTNSPDDQKDEL